MNKIKNLDGFAEGVEDGKVILSYRGIPCPRLGSRKKLCEEDTSYKGELTLLIITFTTPLGVVEYKYSASGGGLERVSEAFRLVSKEETMGLVAEYHQLSRRLADVAAQLALYQ